MSPQKENNNMKYQLFDTPKQWLQSLIEDIEKAEKYIYIEIYRFQEDEIGEKLIKVLSEKCKENVSVKIVVDAWGTRVSDDFFEPIISLGAKVKFYQKIKLTWDFITSNHQRNHRKIIVIDDNISHIGSANFSEYSQNWRESIVRFEGEIANTFKKIFLEYFKNANNHFFKAKTNKKNIKFQDFTIIQDLPSIYTQRAKVHLENLISKSEKCVHIMSPYFIPGYKLRRRMILSARKEIDVNVYFPIHSDVRLVDYLRDKYLGQLHSEGVKIWLYRPNNLHAKVFLFDNETFVFGSSNFDYRSFRYMHEILVEGTDPQLNELFLDFLENTKKDCEAFDYNKWLNRPKIEKFLGWLATPLRYMF